MTDKDVLKFVVSSYGDLQRMKEIVLTKKAERTYLRIPRFWQNRPARNRSVFTEK
mgnify:CR=1 FL=1